MNKKEAKELLSKEIKTLKNKKYTELVKIVDEVETKELLGKSDQKYQIEIQVFWDDAKEGNLRVTVSIDDRGWRSFVPLTDDFIIGPDGTFIGE